MDVYNIIRQLTDQEDVNSGQIKRECFDKLLPIKDYYKGWNFHKTDVRFNFLPNEDYHKERYEVKINVDDDVERVEKIEALNEDIDEYNDWVNEKNELQGKELLEKAPPNTVGAVEDLNLENKYYSTLGKHKPWLCTFQIEHPQFRKIDNSVEFVYCDDEVIYKLMQEMEIEEFVNRFNATLYAYIIEAVGWLKKNNAFDKETLWYEPNREFANWFVKNNLEPRTSEIRYTHFDSSGLNSRGFKEVVAFGVDDDDPIKVKSGSSNIGVDEVMELVSKGGDVKSNIMDMLEDTDDYKTQAQLDEEMKEIFEIRDIVGYTHQQIEREMREIFEEHKGKGYFIGANGKEQLKVCYEWGCKYWTANKLRLTVKQMQKGAGRYPK